MKPAFTISAMPATISLRGNVSRVARSTSTAAGWWNAPTRFLPASVLMPVLPPTAASTMPSSVVGTCTMSTPRSQVAAANPATSVAAPPPRLTIASLRPTPMRPSTSQMNPTTGRSLPASASGISMRWASIPLSDRWFRIASAVCASAGWCRIATLCVPSSVPPSSPSRPVPMITGYGRVDRDLDGHGFSHRACLGARANAAGCRRGGLGGRCRRRLASRWAAPPRRPATASRCGRPGFSSCVHDVAHHRAGIAPVGVDPDRGDLAGTAAPVASSASRYLGAGSPPASSGRVGAPPVRRDPSAALISR